MMKKIKKKKAFALLTVLILTLIISAIVGGVLLVNLSNFQITKAEIGYALAKGAANAGLMRIINEINLNRDCNVVPIHGKIDKAEYLAEVQKIENTNTCFVMSTGTYGKAKVVEVAMIQLSPAKPLIGARAIRGWRHIHIPGGGKCCRKCPHEGRISGCDKEGNYEVAGIISPENLNATSKKGCKYCESDTGNNTGIFGNPPLYSNAPVNDFTLEYFKAECFNSNNSYGDIKCDYGLTDALVDTYARTLSNNKKEFYIDNWDQPIVNMTEIENSLGNCSPPYQNNTLYLSNLESAWENKKCIKVDINGTLTINGTNFIEDRIIYIKNATSVILENLDGNCIGGNCFANGSYDLTIYSPYPVTVTIKDGVTRIRLITTDTINVNTTNLQNVFILQGLNSSDENNDGSSPQYFDILSPGNYTFINAQLFTKQIKAKVNSNYTFTGSLLYFYEYACPDCNRTEISEVMGNCIYNKRGAIVIDEHSHNDYINLQFGNETNPTLVISANTPFMCVRHQDKHLIRNLKQYGLYFAQTAPSYWVYDDKGGRCHGKFRDSYEIYGSVIDNDFFKETCHQKGKYLHEWYDNATVQFKKDIINNLSNEFWFVRKVGNYTIRNIKEQIIQMSQTIY